MNLSTKNVVQCIQCEQNSAYQEANRPAHLWTEEGAMSSIWSSNFTATLNNCLFVYDISGKC